MQPQALSGDVRQAGFYHGQVASTDSPVTLATLALTTRNVCHHNEPSRINRSSSDAQSLVSTDSCTEFDHNSRAARIQHVQRRLTEILDLPPQDPPQIGCAKPGNEKHKIDERRRRGIHGGFMKELERLSEPALVALRSGRGDRFEEWLEPNFYKAAITGNNKKHNTKTAVLLAQVITSLENEVRNLRLEDQNNELKGRTAALEEETKRLRKEISSLKIQGSPSASVQSSPTDSPSSKRIRTPSESPDIRSKQSVLASVEGGLSTCSHKKHRGSPAMPST